MTDSPTRKTYSVKEVWNDCYKRCDALKIEDEDVSDDSLLDIDDQFYITSPKLQEVADKVGLPSVSFWQHEFGLGGTGMWNSEMGFSAGLQAQWSGGWFEEVNNYGPLNVGEYTAQWNLGYGPTEGMFTGFTIDGQAGVGMQFKPDGKRGADFYFMPTVSLGGEIGYNHSYATQQQGAIGMESGIIGQIDDAVLMLSPMVQIGEIANYQAYDGVMSIAVRSDSFQYGARARLIVSEKLLASAEVFYMPNMSDVLPRDDGSGWQGSKARLSIHYAFNADWSIQSLMNQVTYVGSPVRLDGDLGWMQNENVTRNKFTEVSASVTLSRTF
jgi:hypothetical protein